MRLLAWLTIIREVQCIRAQLVCTTVRAIRETNRRKWHGERTHVCFALMSTKKVKNSGTQNMNVTTIDAGKTSSGLILSRLSDAEQRS